MKNVDSQSRKPQPYIIELNGQQIQVTEDVYQAYMRPRWAESRQQKRMSRCLKPDRTRCTGDCSKCPYKRSGSTLSLDQGYDDGFELVDDTVDVEETVLNRLLLEQLSHHLEAADPAKHLLFCLIRQGVPERKIAAIIGISQSALNNRKNKLFTELQNFFKEFS